LLVEYLIAFVVLVVLVVLNINIIGITHLRRLYHFKVLSGALDLNLRLRSIVFVLDLIETWVAEWHQFVRVFWSILRGPQLCAFVDHLLVLLVSIVIFLFLCGVADEQVEEGSRRLSFVLIFVLFLLFLILFLICLFRSLLLFFK